MTEISARKIVFFFLDQSPTINFVIGGIVDRFARSDPKRTERNSFPSRGRVEQNGELRGYLFVVHVHVPVAKRSAGRFGAGDVVDGTGGTGNALETNANRSAQLQQSGSGHAHLLRSLDEKIRRKFAQVSPIVVL